MADPLSFDALASSEHVLSSAENFVLYVRLEAVARGAGGPGGGSRLPLNLGVVIDRSGSMYDERRLEFVIEAVKFLADNLTGDDKVSIVAFADKAKVLITPEAARDKSAIKRAIDDIDLLEIGGGTQMALGMRAAIDEVKKNLGEDRKIGYEMGDWQAGVPGSVLLTLVLPPRKPGQVRILQSNFHYEVPGGAEGTVACDLTVDYTLDRTLTSKRNGRVMNLVDQVSIAKLQTKAEE